MKFIINGVIELRDGKRNFSNEVEAKSEHHARELVYSLFGSRNKLNRNKINIESVSKA